MAIVTMAIGFDSKAWEKGDRDQPMDIKFEGRVLQTYERNGYDDSDFVAIVFAEDNRFKHVEYASTRGWSYPNSARVDATDEVKDLAEAHLINIVYDRLIHAAQEKSQIVKRGCRIEVVKGRKVPKGTQGDIFWVGESQWGTRVGFNDDEGNTHWTAITNVENITEEVIDYEDILRQAKNFAASARKRNQWRLSL
jgi:hypothetical protein